MMILLLFLFRKKINDWIFFWATVFRRQTALQSCWCTKNTKNLFSDNFLVSFWFLLPFHFIICDDLCEKERKKMKDVLFFFFSFRCFNFCVPLTGAKRKEKKRERRVFACLVGRFHKRKRRIFPLFLFPFQNYYHHTLHKAQTVTDIRHCHLEEKVGWKSSSSSNDNVDAAAAAVQYRTVQLWSTSFKSGLHHHHHHLLLLLVMMIITLVLQRQWQQQQMFFPLTVLFEHFLREFAVCWVVDSSAFRFQSVNGRRRCGCVLMLVNSRQQGWKNDDENENELTTIESWTFCIGCCCGCWILLGFKKLYFSKFWVWDQYYHHQSNAFLARLCDDWLSSKCLIEAHKLHQSVSGSQRRKHRKNRETVATQARR